MIKKLDYPKVIERYEEYLSTADRKYELQWKNKVMQYYTCGQNAYEIECLNFLIDTLTIREVIGNELYKDPINLSEYNYKNPEEPLDFTCNCHGFTFANGRHFIDNYFVTNILDDEYLEVTDSESIGSGDFDIVCFRDPSNEWIHSCKYKYELFIQKEGIRKFSVHRSINEIHQIPEYRNSDICYFRRRDRSCCSICLNAIGEPHVKTFANNS